MAYNHKTKLVYIPVQLNSFTYGNTSDWKPVKKGTNLGSLPINQLPTRLDENAPENMDQGVLLAWDPLKQQTVWKVNNPSFSVNSGVMTTAGGLVFQGTADGKLLDCQHPLKIHGLISYLYRIFEKNTFIVPLDNGIDR